MGIGVSNKAPRCFFLAGNGQNRTETLHVFEIRVKQIRVKHGQTSKIVRYIQRYHTRINVSMPCQCVCTYSIKIFHIKSSNSAACLFPKNWGFWWFLSPLLDLHPGWPVVAQVAWNAAPIHGVAARSTASLAPRKGLFSEAENSGKVASIFTVMARPTSFKSVIRCYNML